MYNSAIETTQNKLPFKVSQIIWIDKDNRFFDIRYNKANLFRLPIKSTTDIYFDNVLDYNANNDSKNIAFKKFEDYYNNDDALKSKNIPDIVETPVELFNFLNKQNEVQTPKDIFDFFKPKLLSNIFKSSSPTRKRKHNSTDYTYSESPLKKKIKKKDSFELSLKKEIKIIDYSNWDEFLIVQLYLEQIFNPLKESTKSIFYDNIPLYYLIAFNKIKKMYIKCFYKKYNCNNYLFLKDFLPIILKNVKEYIYIYKNNIFLK
jgi:hypothetical protein